MIDFSVFCHEWTKSRFAFDVPMSKDYKVFVNGTEVPVYRCRISAYPFNTWWPGHQRPVAQSELVSYVNLVSDEPVELAVEPLTQTAYNRIMISRIPKEYGSKNREIGLFSL